MTSKKHIGAIVATIVAMCIFKIIGFRTLSNTMYGRVFLILSILGIGHLNHILGIVIVLFLIVVMSHTDYYEIGLEGYTDASGNTVDASGNAVDASGNTVDASGNAIASALQQKHSEIVQQLRNKMSQAKTDSSTSSANTTTSTATTQPTTSGSNGSNTTTTESFKGREGFNIVDRESSILKGKHSNEVGSFSHARTQSDTVEPAEETTKLDSGLSFSAFS